MKRKGWALAGVVGLAIGLVIGTALQIWRSRGNVPVNQRVYAMNVAISSMAFWNEPKQTWQRIGSTTPGLHTVFGGPPESDPAKQIESIDAMLSQKIDGLVVFSTDPVALVQTVNKAVDSGIPVVTVFADLPTS